LFIDFTIKRFKYEKEKRPEQRENIYIYTNTCRLVWNKNYMLSEIYVKMFRSGRKLVGPAETDIV
jgi:hypothetical protein